MSSRWTPYLVWLLATALSAALFWIGRAVPFVWRNLPAFVAFVFLYLPVMIAWRRKIELATFGFTIHPVRRNAAFGLLPLPIVFPLFFFVFYFFFDAICAPEAPGWMRALAPRGWCPTYLGWDGMRAPALLTWDFAELAFSQVIVIALPEELFFRGYLLGELEKLYPPTRRLLGGGVGKALLVSSALFALGHVLVDLNPTRAIVFVPGMLFGWMRSATGSIAAGTCAHALSNLYMTQLKHIFFA